MTPSELPAAVHGDWRCGLFSRPAWWVERQCERSGWVERDDGSVVNVDGCPLTEADLTVARFCNPMVDLLADLELDTHDARD